MIVADSAPRRNAVRTESMAVLPPPTTATRLPIMTGVSLAGLEASIRLTRVRYSFDDITPVAFSPGIPIKLGKPAPEATKTPQKPSASNCFTSSVLPTIQSFIKCTPNCFRFSISWSTMALGRRNSGIPYFRTPPISCKASKTVTSYPCFTISPANDKPAGPEPTTATFFPFLAALTGATTTACSRS